MARKCEQLGLLFSYVERLAADLDGVSLPRMMENIRIGLRTTRY